MGRQLPSVRPQKAARGFMRPIVAPLSTTTKEGKNDAARFD
jgi:hypothetical protein